MPSSNKEALFALALTKPDAERAAWLDRECGDDKALSARLDALLAVHEQPETLLATQTDAARPTIKLDLADEPDEAVGQTLGATSCWSVSAKAGAAWSRSRSRLNLCVGVWR